MTDRVKITSWSAEIDRLKGANDRLIRRCAELRIDVRALTGANDSLREELTKMMWEAFRSWENGPPGDEKPRMNEAFWDKVERVVDERKERCGDE